MDKFGVVTDEAVTCPICGTDVLRDGQVIRCPVHGSKPFEGNLSDETPEKHVDSGAKKRSVSSTNRQS